VDEGGSPVSETVASQLGSDATRSQRGAAWRGYAVVFAATALFLYLRNFRGGVFVWGISQQEGTWIDEAFFTLQGELIYRDFFEMMPPGIVYINTFFLWLLGPTTTSVGIIVVIIGVICALAVYAISASVLSGYWRYVPAAIFVGLTYPSYSLLNHKWPTIILCLLGILAVLEKRSRLRCALSGMAYGGAMLCTQDFGVGAAFGMVVALWLLRGRKDGSHPVIFAVACGLTVLVVMGGFAAAAGLATVWYAVVAYMFEQYGTSQALVVGFGGLRNFPIWCTSFGLGGLGLGYAVVGIARRFWRSDPPSLVIIAFAGAGLLLIGGLAHPIEPTLFGVRAVPLTIVGTYLLQRMVQQRVAHPWTLVGLTVLGALLLADAVLRPIRIQFVLPLLPEAHRAGTLLAPRGYLDDLAWLEANTVEGQPIFLYPDKAGFFFLSRTRSATYYPKLFDMSLSSDAQVADAIDQLARKCPAVGIWHRSRLLAFGLNRPELHTLKPLEEALMRDYDVIAEFPNGASGLRRKVSTSECGK
jgi:hypothetical protein